jgi:hypothetical protein
VFTHCQLHCDTKHANDHTTLTHGQNSASVITRVLENKQSPAYSFQRLSVRMSITRPNYHAEFDTTHTVHLVGHVAFVTHKTSFHLGEQAKFNISNPVTGFRKCDTLHTSYTRITTCKFVQFKLYNETSLINLDENRLPIRSSATPVCLLTRAFQSL